MLLERVPQFRLNTPQCGDSLELLRSAADGSAAVAGEGAS
jgi:hypothetical protein